MITRGTVEAHVRRRHRSRWARSAAAGAPPGSRTRRTRRRPRRRRAAPRAARRHPATSSSWWCRPPRCPTPPAFAAATMAARKPMCSVCRYTARATVAPMIAAAMLSRNEESTNTSASSTTPPFQSSGRMRGSSCGTWLSSKCRESSAKPTSSANRLARITHSLREVPMSPPGPACRGSPRTPACTR